MISKTTLASVFLVFGAMLSNVSHADHVARECATCDSHAEASLIAQLAGHGLDEGNHTVFVVNLTNTNAWKFNINVVDTSTNGNPNGQPTFGHKFVTVLSFESAPQPVIDGLNDMKAAGLNHLKEDVILTVELDASQLNGECFEASGGLCADVVHHLQGLPETRMWAAANRSIGVIWSKLAELIFSIAGPQLQYIVVFPDGSFEIYVYLGPGQGTGFDVKANTSVTAQGTPVGAWGGATLDGWLSLSDGPVPFTIYVFGPGGGGSTCISYTVTVSGSGVTEVTHSDC